MNKILVWVALGLIVFTTAAVVVLGTLFLAFETL
jgi:hypothetical protein